MVVITRVPTITPSDSGVEISGTLMCSPPLMNDSVFSCRACNTSLMPMKPRMNDRPNDRKTSLSSNPPSRKYSWRRPISAKALAVKTMYGSSVRP